MIQNLNFTDELQAQIAAKLESEPITPIQKEYVHKINNDYVFISDFEKIPDENIVDKSLLDKRSYHYVFACPKLDDIFCFDHELDHVPFIMSVEYVRQISLAISHRLHNIPFVGYITIMDEIEFNSHKYVELDIPVVIVFEDIILKQRGNRYERVVNYHLYQNFILCATMSMKVMVMDKGLYSRHRQNSRTDLIKNLSVVETPITNVQLLNSRFQPALNL